MTGKTFEALPPAIQQFSLLLKEAAAEHKALSSALGKAATARDWDTHAAVLAARNAAIQAEKDFKADGAAARALSASGLSDLFETSIEVGGKTVKVVPLAGFVLGLANDMADGNSVSRRSPARRPGWSTGTVTASALAPVIIGATVLPGVGEVVIVAVLAGAAGYAASKAVEYMWHKWGGSVDDAWHDFENGVSGAVSQGWHVITHPGDWF